MINICQGILYMLFINKYSLHQWFLFLVLLCSIVAGSCKSNQKVKESNKEAINEFRCSGSEYLPTIDYFRIHQIGESIDQPTSMRKAIKRAQREMAKIINSTLNEVLKDYMVSKGVIYNETMKDQLDAISEAVGNESTQKVNIICEETIKTLNGLYKTSVVLEISTNDVLKEARKKISENFKFQVNINVSEFRNIFEKQMNKTLNKPISQ